MSSSDAFSPPAYYDRMATDLTQPPVQLYPGYSSPYGPWYGFYFGQRGFTEEDMRREMARRQKQMEQRAATSGRPEDKYINPKGQLDPRTAAIFKALRSADQARQMPVMMMPVPQSFSGTNKPGLLSRIFRKIFG